MGVAEVIAGIGVAIAAGSTAHSISESEQGAKRAKSARQDQKKAIAKTEASDKQLRREQQEAQNRANRKKADQASLLAAAEEDRFKGPGSTFLRGRQGGLGGNIGKQTLG